MKKNNYLLAFTFFTLFPLGSIFGQTLLNGSFEATTGNCDYNLTNSNFNSMMNNCYAFGNNSQIDIINSTCGYGSAQQGNYFIGLGVDIANALTDALSLKLLTPIIVGNTYVLNFYNRKDSGFNANLLEVGYSTDSISFGNIIDTAALPTTSWGLVSFSFTPTVNCQFLTIRTIAGSYGWNFVDNFTISQTTGIINSFDEAFAIQVFPNPTSNFISIQADNSINIITATIKDIQGSTVLVTDKTTIDLSDFGAGTFIVELNTNKGRIIKRIIRE
jgi:hypothetical protein